MQPDRTRGVFETLRVVNGEVQALEAHVKRLESSLRELYGQPLPSEALARLHATYARDAPRGAVQRMRIDVEPRDGRLGVAIAVDAARPDITAPVALAPVTLPGGLGAHKWRDRSLLDSLGSDPVPLLVDEDGSVLEAAWANVWTLRGQRLTTPPASGRILAGVTRALLLERASALGLTATEQPIMFDELRAADAIVLTSSVRLAVAAGLGAPPATEPAVVATIRAALARSIAAVRQAPREPHRPAHLREQRAGA